MLDVCLCSGCGGVGGCDFDQGMEGWDGGMCEL